MGKIPPLRRKVAPPKKAPKPQPEETEDLHDDTEDDAGYLAFGEKADEQIAQYREQVATPFVREFFISSKEIAASDDDMVTVRTHLLFDYTQKAWNSSAPFITVMENNRPVLCLSPGDDCALQAGGLSPSIRPIYVLMDHRKFKTKQGATGSDNVKVWIPPSGVTALLSAAVLDLKDNLGLDAEDHVDISRYELKITKSGTGRKSTWALAFTAREKPLTDEQLETACEFFKTETLPDVPTVRKTLGSMFKPNPKYLLSRNGNRPYQKAGGLQQQGDDDDEGGRPF